MLNTPSNIPHVIHQIGPEDQATWHPIWKTCQQSIFHTFPDIEYKLWNDREDIDRVVYDHYYEFWNLYQALPVHIMKIDFARFCILHRFGGLYLDLDYFVYQSFFDQINQEVCLLGNNNLMYTDAVVENSLMYSSPNHPFWFQCLKNIKYAFIKFRNQFKPGEQWRSDISNSGVVNSTTGSKMLEFTYLQFKSKSSIQVLSGDTFNPIPCYYSTSLYGKHFHTSIWGNEYLPIIEKQKLVIHQNTIYLLNKEEEFNLKPHTELDFSEFDFYHNYCDT